MNESRPNSYSCSSISNRAPFQDGWAVPEPSRPLTFTGWALARGRDARPGGSGPRHIAEEHRREAAADADREHDRRTGDMAHRPVDPGPVRDVRPRVDRIGPRAERADHEPQRQEQQRELKATLVAPDPVPRMRREDRCRHHSSDQDRADRGQQAGPEREAAENL